MQTVTVGVIRVRDVYIQKSSLPTVAGGAKKIDSSPAKTEKTADERLMGATRTRQRHERVSGAKRVLTGRPEEIEKLWSRAQNLRTLRTASF